MMVAPRCFTCGEPCDGMATFTVREGRQHVTSWRCTRCDAPTLYPYAAHVSHAASVHEARRSQLVQTAQNGTKPSHAPGVAVLIDSFDLIENAAQLGLVQGNQPARHHQCQPHRGLLHSVIRRVRSLASRLSATTSLRSHHQAPSTASMPPKSMDRFADEQEPFAAGANV